MGVPAFFRWLTKRYPKIVIDALSFDDLEHLLDNFNKVVGEQGEGKGTDPNEINLESDDMTEAERRQMIDRDIQAKIDSNNPEFDNLYLDMNGIIHPCTHPPGKESPNTDVEMFNNIFEYIDKIMVIVKPQKVIYMAIDGVAPRAKMNQQRARRFKGALEIEEQLAREQEIKSTWSNKGIKFTDSSLGKEDTQFDKNVITPGTEFMWRLSKSIQHYVYDRTHNDKLWKGVKVIFSDSSIPGEGEHKILDFIRSQRCQPGYDPNTRHCIYGADADLIMLGLSTHEPHFSVIREAFVPDFEKVCKRCGKHGHLYAECPQTLEAHTGQKVRAAQAVSFQFVKLNVVREYLYLEFKDVKLPFPFDFERVIDDFVFFCFFVGNDFLPHLPSLHIREGAIDAIMAIYKYQLPALGDYLTCNGKIDFNRVDLIFNDISRIEEELIKSKKQYEDRMKQNEARQPKPQQQQQQQSFKTPQGVRYNLDGSIKPPVEEVPKAGSAEVEESSTSKAEKAIQELLEKSKDGSALDEEELNKLAAQRMKDIVKKLLDEKNQKIADKYVDKVQLGTEGWKLRYYQNKFHVSQEDLQEFLANIKRTYLEGLQWVYSYYYNGCVSWTWFYPFHYAPFASDLLNAGANLDIKFEMGKPAEPFEQLLGVFPKQSAHAIPLCYRSLLSDPKSDIIDFYPTNFHTDVNGARYAWMGVVLLPFIDRHRLVKAMKKADRNGEALTEHEKELNRPGEVYVFFHSQDAAKTGLAQGIDQVTTTLAAKKPEDAKASSLDLFASFTRSDNISGTIRVTQTHLQGIGKNLKSPYNRLSLETIESNLVHRVPYEQSGYQMHLTRLLERVTEPEREVDDFEIFHVNRRFFNGEKAIQMLERILGFESNLSNISRGYNNSGRSGYLNNRAVEYEGVTQQSQGGRGGYQQRQTYGEQTSTSSSGVSSNYLGKRPNRDFENPAQQQRQETYQNQRPKQESYQSQGYQQNYQPRQQQQESQGGYNQRPNYDQHNRGGYQQQNYQQPPRWRDQAPYQSHYHQQIEPVYQQPQQTIDYNLRQHQNPVQPQAPQGAPQQPQQFAQNILIQPPQQSSNLMNLISQLGQIQGGVPQNGQNSQGAQKPAGPSQNNRFHGFNE